MMNQQSLQARRRDVRVLEVQDADLFTALELKESLDCSDEARGFTLFENAMRAHYMSEYASGRVAKSFNVGEVVICRDNSNRFYRVRVTEISGLKPQDECKGQSVDYGKELYFLPERVFTLVERFSHSRMPFQVKHYRVDGVVPAISTPDVSGRAVLKSTQSFSEEARTSVRRLLTSETVTVTVQYELQPEHGNNETEPIAAIVMLSRCREAGDTEASAAVSMCLNDYLLAKRFACRAQTAKRAESREMTLRSRFESTSFYVTFDGCRDFSTSTCPRTNESDTFGISGPSDFDRSSGARLQSQQKSSNSDCSRESCGGPLLLGYCQSVEADSSATMASNAGKADRRFSVKNARNANATIRLNRADSWQDRCRLRRTGFGLLRRVASKTDSSTALDANSVEPNCRVNEGVVDEKLSCVIDAWYNRTSAY